MTEEEKEAKPSMDLWANLAEEVFFFQYHLHQDRSTTLSMPINERKWMIERFIQQKNRESEAMEAARRASKSGAKH